MYLYKNNTEKELVIPTMRDYWHSSLFHSGIFLIRFFCPFLFHTENYYISANSREQNRPESSMRLNLLSVIFVKNEISRTKLERQIWFAKIIDDCKLPRWHHEQEQFCFCMFVLVSIVDDVCHSKRMLDVWFDINCSTFLFLLILSESAATTKPYLLPYLNFKMKNSINC